MWRLCRECAAGGPGRLAHPLNWEVQIGRSALSANPDWPAIAVRGGGLLVLAILAIAISVRTFRSYARNV